MTHLLLLSILSTGPAAAADSTCTKVTAEWITALEASGCPPLGRISTRMKSACLEVTTLNWSRDQKSAKKTFLSDCVPTTEGFPGVRAPIGEEGRTISHCGRLVHRARGDRPDDPIPQALAPDNGFDKVAGIVTAAGFACSDPTGIDRCSLPTSVHTAMDQLLVQEQSCKGLQDFPLDSTMWAVGLLSEAMPVDPFARAEQVRGIIDDKTNLQQKKQQEETSFQSARTEELVRAKVFAADCLVPPANMHEPDQAGTALSACDNLLSLWRGDDADRRELEADHKIPEKYANTLAGKVLNSASLQVADQARVQDRSAMLKEHQEHLIKKNFPEILQEQGAQAGQAYLVKYGPLIDEAWVQDARDRVLERETREAAEKKKKKQ